MKRKKPPAPPQSLARRLMRQATGKAVQTIGHSTRNKPNVYRKPVTLPKLPPFNDGLL